MKYQEHSMCDIQCKKYISRHGNESYKVHWPSLLFKMETVGWSEMSRHAFDFFIVWTFL